MTKKLLSRYGKWTVIGQPQRATTCHDYLVRCRCDCGTEKDVWLNTLRSRSDTGCTKCADRYKGKYKARLYEAFGEQKTMRDWVKDTRCRIPAATLYRRIQNGWPMQLALIKPVQPQANRTKG
jgi:hypothetical protein